MYATNNAYANAGNAYKSNEVMTASKKKLVIMLYDGAAKNLKLAKMAINEGDIEKTNSLIIKAQDILAELMSTINFDHGGEIAENLMSLYRYMYERTVRANIDKDKSVLDEVISFLEELSQVWSRI
ncbi:flagellar export chaperone FliS [Alkalibacter mobilis]|uniref:flagellar export chaperone FliS n=1 Tax=Alkalibacter mobilis TaxID=2787712 RepID=UPI00189FF1E6|nr:flagellar export chaperone FliS [Alkalibacter mobilis]MBF7096329.1 flagellar export chaperone FliS [Alkalibacter mobilis]